MYSRVVCIRAFEIGDQGVLNATYVIYSLLKTVKISVEGVSFVNSLFCWLKTEFHSTLVFCACLSELL